MISEAKLSQWSLSSIPEGSAGAAKQPGGRDSQLQTQPMEFQIHPVSGRRLSDIPLAGLPTPNSQLPTPISPFPKGCQKMKKSLVRFYLLQNSPTNPKLPLCCKGETNQKENRKC